MENVSLRVIGGLVCAAALAPGSASASVVYVPVNSGFYTSYTTTVVGHSLDWTLTHADGPVDFLDPATGNYIRAWYSDTNDLFTGAGLSFTSGALQTAGTTFDASDTYVSSEMVLEKLRTAKLGTDSNGNSFSYYETTFGGPWFTPQDGYVGLQIDIGGETHYGWAHFESDGLFTDLNFIAYGYETTPDKAINAADIPEPASLALLAAGLAGLTALRRRKKQ